MNRVILIGMLLLVSCKGPKGEKGDSGGGATYSYQGLISNNDFFVAIPAFTSTSSISVYIGNGTSFSPLNSYSPSLSMNIYYIAYPGTHSVEIVNAQNTGLTTYKIVVTNGVAAAGYRALL